jgi:hypothetical protein
MNADSTLAGLRFLAGRWRGEGTLRGVRITSFNVWRDDADGSLRLSSDTLRDGQVVHRECAVLREAAPGRIAATSSSDRVPAQSWDVAAVEAGRWTLTHPGFAWEIRRESDDVYAETFDEVRSLGSAERVVELRHVRVPEPPR